MILHDLKCVFVHIPKTGGCSVVDCLLSRRKTSNHRYLRQDVSKRTKNYFIFTFIRNPFDRFVSAYFYFKTYGRRFPGDIKMGKVVNIYESFNDFVLNFNNISRDEFGEPHFDPQITWMDDRIDFIGRFENFQEDFNVVCNKAGIPQRQLPHKNKVKHKHYTEYYSAETREIVAKKYAKDIKIFGYKFG